MKVINTEKRPIKLWLDDIEDGALIQAKNLANLPFLFKHVAIMPDSHQGYGMPIGGVVATKNVIIPNAVGVDIGCGMIAVKTSLTEMSQEELKKIMGVIRTKIPTGRNHHPTPQDETNMPGEVKINSVVSQEYDSALKQIGTLGGGNHFIEIQKGDNGFVWIMIHSGSRNLGFKVANHYNDIAKTLNEKWHVSVPKSLDLAFLPSDSQEGQDYLFEMQYCVDFAEASRKLMMSRVKEVINDVFDFVSYQKEINIAHNYVALENHFGENVWVHRKGATRARSGELGIIPGSQGSSSYIVSGKGNAESFKSCSHGAGRKMSRTMAQKQLNFDEQKKILDDLNVVHGMRNAKDLDEAPGAYKNIDEVMKCQSDLVDIIVKLKPLAVIKG